MTGRRCDDPAEPFEPPLPAPPVSMSIGQRFGFALLFVWALITGVAFCTGGLLMAFTGSLDEGPLIGKLMAVAVLIVCLSGYSLAGLTLKIPRWRRERELQKIEALSKHYIVHHAVVLIVFSLKIDLFVLALFPAIVGFVLSGVVSAMARLHIPLAVRLPTARLVRAA